MKDRVPVPWWRIATVALLAVALGIALASGHTGDAIIVAVLMVPGLVLVGVALYFHLEVVEGRKPRRDSLGGRAPSEES